MNILKEIEEQINSIKKIDNSTYLDSIFTHIDRAEFYYKQGKNDINYFNDVIYRSNQAYEGALKESYKVLAEKSEEEVTKKSPNEIEKFFETNNVFRERVLQLFRNYRQEWRNKSTHDYKLFFDESEAFIALTSVTSFAHLLLKQIQEKTAYLAQQKKLADKTIDTKSLKSIANSEETPVVSMLTDAIIDFSKQNNEYIYNDTDNIKEFEISGLLHAYLESINGDPENVIITREPLLNSSERYLRPDFIIKIGEASVILELKRSRTGNHTRQNAINQVLIYMQAANIFEAIIYNANFNKANSEPRIEESVKISNEKIYKLTIITV